MNSNQKGAIAEAAIALHAIKLGIPVLKPIAEHAPYDLAFELGERIIRVQCKWAALIGATIRIHTTRCRTKKRGYVRRQYRENEIDALAAYCADLDRTYLLPNEMATQRSAVHLRIEPPKNGQRAAINWAPQYELGAVAQLDRAPVWHTGGRGFESHQLHSSVPRIEQNVETVGANRFRNRFGYYMERAAAGMEIVISRRGRPFARLGPAAVQRTLGSAD
jgi:prevent-host-death family protein